MDEQDCVACVAYIIAKFVFKLVLSLAFVYVAVRLSIYTGHYAYLWFLVIPALSLFSGVRFERFGGNCDDND